MTTHAAVAVVAAAAAAAVIVELHLDNNTIGSLHIQPRPF